MHGSSYTKNGLVTFCRWDSFGEGWQIRVSKQVSTRTLGWNDWRAYQQWSRYCNWSDKYFQRKSELFFVIWYIILIKAPLTVSASRAEYVDFSTPFQEFQFSIVMKKTSAEEEDESDESLTAFSPFHLYLWLAIFFTVIGMVFISLVIEWSFKSPETHGEGFVNFLRQDSIFRPE